MNISINVINCNNSISGLWGPQKYVSVYCLHAKENKPPGYEQTFTHQ